VSTEQAERIYCGTEAGGIFQFTFHPGTRELSRPVLVEGTDDSGYLAAHPSRPVIYSVNQKQATLTAYAMAADGSLTAINKVETRGKTPCHVAVDERGRFVLAANYNGGVSLFTIRPDGGVSEAAFVYQPVGSGPDPKRQKKPHPHGVAFAPGLDLAYANDLGCDRIWALKIAGSPPSLTLDPGLTRAVHPGSGPRHLAIHRSGRFAAAVTEMGSTVVAFRREPATGALTETNTVSTLLPGCTARSWAAEVGYHPTLDLCYASNRGDDSLAVFSLDPATGKLAWVRRIESGGERPWHFAFDREGSALFVANTGSGRVSAYCLGGDGLPVDSLGTLEIGKPMCLLFAPARG